LHCRVNEVLRSSTMQFISVLSIQVLNFWNSNICIKLCKAKKKKYQWSTSIVIFYKVKVSIENQSTSSFLFICMYKLAYLSVRADSLTTIMDSVQSIVSVYFTMKNTFEDTFVAKYFSMSLFLYYRSWK
jgi:hypothetical protein